MHRRESKAVLTVMGANIVIERPPAFTRTECAICLKRIHKGEQLTLECKHAFHGECLRKWATKDNTAGILDVVSVRLPHKQVHLFKEGDNIITCPCCRAEYTHDIFTAQITKVLAKIHFFTQHRQSCSLHNSLDGYHGLCATKRDGW